MLLNREIMRENRKKHGYTQDDVAALLSVDRVTYARYETGQSLPRADKLPRLAKILGCTVDDLLMDT